MTWKNKFIISFATLVLCICSFIGVMIFEPFDNKTIIIIIGIILILLFFFATFFTTICYRRWQGYYSKNNQFLISVENEKELINSVIENLLILGYDKKTETENYDLYELQKNRTKYYFLIYKNGNNHKEKSYLKLVKEIDKSLMSFCLKLSTKSGHLVIIEELMQQDKTKLYTESKKLTCDFVMLDYNNKCSYIESSSLLNAVEQRREIKKVLKDVVIFDSL